MICQHSKVQEFDGDKWCKDCGGYKHLGFNWWLPVRAITFRFAIEQPVKIKDLEIKGIVIATYNGRRGIEYNVRYPGTGKYEEVYFYEQELEEIKEGL